MTGYADALELVPEVGVTWIYPPNWDGNPPPVGWRKIEVRLFGWNLVDEESYVQKIDISELRTVSGNPPTRTTIEKIKYNVTGLEVVRLQWDRNPKATIAILPPGWGEFCAELEDPGEEGGVGDGTGDIILTTIGAGSGYYDITLKIRLRD